jgi:hypothetical protein
MWRSAPFPSPLLWWAFSFPPPLLCASFQFIVYCSVFFFFLQGCGQTAQGAMLVYLRGGSVSTKWHLVFTCLVCWMTSKQVCSQLLATAAVHLFSQCNVAWRSFLCARGSGCLSFDSPWCFISAKCGSSASAWFLIHGAHAVCFCALIAILDPPLSNFNQIPITQN